VAASAIPGADRRNPEAAPIHTGGNDFPSLTWDEAVQAALAIDLGSTKSYDNVQ
jgi:hypothetical protein